MWRSNTSWCIYRRFRSRRPKWPSSSGIYWSAVPTSPSRKAAFGHIFAFCYPSSGDRKESECANLCCSTLPRLGGKNIFGWYWNTPNTLQFVNSLLHSPQNPRSTPAFRAAYCLGTVLLTLSREALSVVKSSSSYLVLFWQVYSSVYSLFMRHLFCCSEANREVASFTERTAKNKQIKKQRRRKLSVSPTKKGGSPALAPVSLVSAKGRTKLVHLLCMHTDCHVKNALVWKIQLNFLHYWAKTIFAREI